MYIINEVLFIISDSSKTIVSTRYSIFSMAISNSFGLCCSVGKQDQNAVFFHLNQAIKVKLNG